MFASRRSVLFAAAGIVGSAAAASPTKSAAPYGRDADGQSLFIRACLAANKEEIESYLASGAGLDIHEASAAGRTARVEEILAVNSGSVNHRDLEGAAPLHYAAACGHVAMANVLLSKGADLSARAAGLAGATPAHCAAECADPVIAMQLAQTIVGNGADPRVAKDDGTTVLHLAARRGHADLVSFLLRKGADVSAKDAAGKTPVDVAAPAVVEILRDPARVKQDCYTSRFRDVPRNDTYGIPQSWINQFVTFSHFNLEQVKRLHSQCSDLLLTRSTWDEIGVEAGAHMGREDIAQFFVEKGAPVSLCTATMLGWTDEVKKLLADDPNRVGERGAHDFPLLWYTFGKRARGFVRTVARGGGGPTRRDDGRHNARAGAEKGIPRRRRGVSQIRRLIVVPTFPIC